MSDALELHDSRVNRIEWTDGTAQLHFSLAYIHKSKGKPGRDPGTVWSQEAKLTLWEANASGSPPNLPDAIVDGFLEVGDIRHALIPLPFRRKVDARLYLLFANGTKIDIRGKRPIVELLGMPVFLEEFL